MNDDRPAAPDLRPMSLGELLDRALQLFRQLWRPLLLIGLIGVIPAVLSNLTVIAGPVVSRPIPFTSFFFQSRVPSGGTNWIKSIGDLLVGPLVSGSVIMLTTQAILGQTVSLAAGMRASLRRYFALLGTAFLVAITSLFSALGLGLLAFISPLIAIPLVAAVLLYFSVIWAFSSQAVLIDEIPGGSQALTRSSSLIKGRFWPITGFVILLGLGMILVGLGAGIPLGFILRLLPGGPAADWLKAVASALPAAIIAPATVLATTLLYYDTRMRKEGFDLAYNAALPDEPVS